MEAPNCTLVLQPLPFCNSIFVLQPLLPEHTFWNITFLLQPLFPEHTFWNTNYVSSHSKGVPFSQGGLELERNLLSKWATN